MNLQESMDFAVQKIVEQGGRCLASGNCAYGDDKGNHCAVGWLLDATNDDLMYFDSDVEELSCSYPESIPEIIPENTEAFGDLQQFHDTPRKFSRETLRTRLHLSYGINTSGEHWEQWVDMGE